MDFRYTPEEQRFRMEVRQFIEEEIPVELKTQKNGEGEKEFIPLEMAVLKKMAARGWLGAAFPKEYGGWGTQTLVPMTEYILIDELNGANCTSISLSITYLVTVIGNTLLNCGSDQLKKEFLPRMLNAEVRVCICYSEPDAGNDIAAIRTTAVLDGDHYVLNGSKRFITKADTADYMWTLVREPGTTRHKGMGIILVSTKTPGVTIHPVEMANGITTCEVFFDDVRVPKHHLVGELGMGWKYLMEALSRERATMINFKNISEPWEQFVQWIRVAEVDGERLAEDPVLRQSLANMQLNINLGKMLQLIAGSRSMNKDYICTMEGAANKMWRASISWPEAALGVDILGLYGLMHRDNPSAPLKGKWADIYGWAGHEMSGAGGQDLNRQIIAQVGLGLPKPKF